ncbi:MAG: 50S ribosomal protein L4 [Patescibacteria group bacterium]|nr:50S ribosomal protein L4 [Patescibacteria group bacterium]
MKTAVYNQKGEKKGEIELPKEIFGLKLNSNLVHQVVISQMANKRRVIAHTKDRSEVSGGGKKPWRQKGTGRARHGSSRSPIWRGGGVTFGPTNKKVFKKKIPKKMKRTALFQILSSKARDDSLFVLDNIDLGKIKTKSMKEILNKFSSKNESSLIALQTLDKNVILSSRNIPRTKTIQTKDINALDLLSFKYLIISEQGIESVKETFLK